MNSVDTATLEKLILYQSIRNPYYMGSIIEHIKTDYFEDRDVKNIVNVIKKYYDKTNKYPNLTEIKLFLNNINLRKSFKNIRNEFKELDHDVDIELLIAQTEQFFRQKAVINTMLSVSENFKSLSHEEILRQFESSCNISIITDIGHDYFEDIETHIRYLQSEQEKISTGFDFIDKALKGGLNKKGKALYILMGGTNAGKSIFLGNIAVNILQQNYCVPIISLEMDEQVYSHRISANLSGISMDELKSHVSEFRDAIKDVKSKIPNGKLVIKEFPPGQLTVAKLDSYLSKLKKRGYGFDVVILDYITLMKTLGDNLYERGKRLAEDIRALSYKYEVSFVTVIQANRTGTKDHTQPKLDNTSESMGIAHTADFIMSIWTSEEDVETNTIRGGILKNRIGQNYGVQLFELDPKFLRLREIDSIFEEDRATMNKELKSQLSHLEEQLS